MDIQLHVKKALNEIERAEALVEEAGKLYYSARKRLEGVYSPTAQKGSSKATLKKIHQAITRRDNYIKKQTGNAS